MPHWLDKVITLLRADTSDLRELAEIAGGDPKTFYRGIDIGDLDLAGQDLQGIEFADVTNHDIARIKMARSKEERVIQVLDNVLQNRSKGAWIIDQYQSDRSWHAIESLSMLRLILDLEIKMSVRVSNLALLITAWRPLANAIGGQGTSGRANFKIHMTKYLAKYPDINALCDAAKDRTLNECFAPHKHEIRSFFALANAKGLLGP